MKLICCLGTHEWDKFISPEELQILVEKDLHAKVVSKKGLVVSPIIKAVNLLRGSSVEWSLSDHDLDINYIIHAVKVKSN